MAEIRAFRGVRYDLGRVGALSDVVAPPYDVIDPALQQSLYDRRAHLPAYPWFEAFFRMACGPPRGNRYRSSQLRALARQLLTHRISVW